MLINCFLDATRHVQIPREIKEAIAQGRSVAEFKEVEGAEEV